MDVINDCLQVDIPKASGEFITLMAIPTRRLLVNVPSRLYWRVQIGEEEITNRVGVSVRCFLARIIGLLPLKCYLSIRNPALLRTHGYSVFSVIASTKWIILSYIDC